MSEMGVTFNGVDLTKWLTVTSEFTALGGGDFDPILEDYSVSNGSDFSYTRKAKKVIKVPFFVRYDNITQYDELQQVLNVSEPKRLSFSYLPNRYFLAVPTGDLDFNEIKVSGKGTISFVVPDGLAHSNNVASFDFAKNEHGTWEATIINNGSEAVPISYRVNLKKESGYLGIISDKGALQFGKIEEIDGVMAEKSVVLSKNDANKFTNWTDGTIFYENRNKKIVTTMTNASNATGWLGGLPLSFVNTSNGGQYGACKELNLSETADNWYIWARAWFETDYMGQTGAWCLTVIDENNNLIAGMTIEKSDTIGNTAVVHFLVGDGKGGSISKKAIEFTPSFWVSSNPYSAESAMQNRNMFDLRKEGDKITFFFYGVYYPFIIPELKTVKAKKVQFFLGQYNKRNTARDLLSKHGIRDFSFTKLNVPYWKDIPNRYPAGTELLVYGKKGEFYVNGKWMPDDEILGTTYFMASPGKTKVQLVTSSFSEIEKAVATIEEAYL